MKDYKIEKFHEVAKYGKEYLATAQALQQQSQSPLNQVYEIERDISHLAHLSSVDALMVNQALGHAHIGVDKKYTKQIDCSMTAQRWHISAFNYLHP